MEISLRNNFLEGYHSGSQIARQKYKTGELIVEDGECQSAQMAVVIPDKDLEWVEI